MKTLLLAAALLFSVNFAEASESFKKPKRSNVPKSKIVYNEPGKKSLFGKSSKSNKIRKVKVRPEMFAGDGSGPSNPRLR